MIQSHRLTAFLVPVMVSAMLSVPASGQDEALFSIRKNFRIFGSLYEELTAGYVEDIDPERIMRTGIHAMLETLDPYTTFINEAQTEELDIRSQQRSGGVGLEVAVRDDRLMVVTPLEGYPAFDQGVRAGDEILTIGGRPVDGLSAYEAGELLGGDPGTTIEVVVRRTMEAEPISFVLTRTRYRVRDVTYTGIVGGDHGIHVGYVRLERFGQESLSGVSGSIRELMEQQSLDGLILDLRDNPGGLLGAAVTVSGAFIPSGSLVVSTRGRSLESRKVYHTRQAPVAPEVPLVVLINGASASASEIVAGAIQDLDRGVVIGSRSFGKGLVQQIKSLPYLTALRMTTALYYTPSGRSIQARRYGSMAPASGERVPDSLRHSFTTEAGRVVMDGGGIEPDIKIDESERSEFEEALIRRSAFSRFAGTYAASVDTLPVDFEVDDGLLYAFRDWIGDNPEFDYVTEAERQLETFREEFREGDYQESLEVLEDLESAIIRDKARDFDRDRVRIRERLRRALIARFYPETDQIEAALRHDQLVLSAIDLFKDPERYHELLHP